MRRLVVGLIGVVLAVGGVGGVAGAQAGPAPTADVVAAAIVADGWYADPGAVGDREQLAQVAARLSVRGEPMGFALLAAEPAGSSTAFAEEVLDAILAGPTSRVRTVVVLSDADVGVVSDVWSDAAIDAALDDTIDDLRADRTDGLEALADALAAEPEGFDDSDDDSGSGGGGGSNAGWIGLGIVVVVGVLLLNRLPSATADGDDDGGSSSSWSRRRRSSFRSFSSGRRSSGGSSSRRSSSRSSSRGRGGRRL